MTWRRHWTAYQVQPWIKLIEGFFFLFLFQDGISQFTLAVYFFYIFIIILFFLFFFLVPEALKMSSWIKQHKWQKFGTKFLGQELDVLELIFQR